MKIKIVYEKLGKFFSGHIYLYAWSDSKNDFLDDCSDLRVVKFDYYSNNGATFQVGKMFWDFPIEDENSVILNVNINFHEYCKRLQSLFGFRNGDNFHNINRNCVHAVLAALRVADIHLDINKNVRCKHLFACCCFPSSIVTPKELLQTIKAYKQDNCEEFSTISENCEYSTYSEELLQKQHLLYTAEQKALFERNIRDASIFCLFSSGIIAGVSMGTGIPSSLFCSPWVTKTLCTTFSLSCASTTTSFFGTLFYKNKEEATSNEIVKLRDEIQEHLAARNNM